jgi:hypothetical protein
VELALAAFAVSLRLDEVAPHRSLATEMLLFSMHADSIP